MNAELPDLDPSSPAEEMALRERVRSTSFLQ